jgi:hypothetical protein
MTSDKNVSPVGWYFGSYLLRFVDLGDKSRDDPERRFLSWENTVLVKAKFLDAAYDKVEKVGKSNSKAYRGGPDGVPVQWEFVGITELLPIYEKLADCSEISWVERTPRKLSKLQEWVKPKGAFHQ